MRRTSRTPQVALVAAAVAAIVLALPARADTVVLKNGRKLVGTVVREDERKVVLSVPGMGEMTIDRSTVKEIEKGAVPAPAPKPPAPPAPAPAPPAAPPASAPAGPPASSPSPAPAPAAPPTAPAAPSRPMSPEAVAALMDSTGPWKLVQGTAADNFAAVAQQAGLALKVTEKGAAALPGARPVQKAVESKLALRKLLESLSDSMRTKLGARVRGSELHVGLSHEVNGETAVPRGKALVWADAKGDAEKGGFDPPGWKRPDLLELSVEARGGRVRIELTFANDVRQTLSQKTPKGTQMAYDLAELHFDVDGNEATGDALGFDRNRTGWEARVTVTTGFELTQKSGPDFSQWGNIETVAGTHTVRAVLATYRLQSKADPASGGGLRVKDPSDSESAGNLTKIDGRRIVAEVPYAKLGVKPGSRVRVGFQDELEHMFSTEKISQAAWLDVQ